MPDISLNMTLEEQIGQLLMVGFPGTTVTPEIIELIQKHHVGGVILFSRNVGDAQQVLELTQNLQSIAKAAGQRYPLCIATDQENGMVQRLGKSATQFPGNMALGAIGSEQLAYEVAEATGRELLALGINYNLAPVVDVNNNAANPVIGVRSFGEDPREVAHLGAAAVSGYHHAGVISCLKHFPGHGDTTVDSHLSLPTLPYMLERLESLELLPFQSGIAAGADSVMIAHIAFPALTGDDTLPATLSAAIVRGLLREKLGFTGVIISDCLEMNAISETVGIGPGAVMALQAGIDLVLISHLYERQRAGIAAIVQAVHEGTLSRDVIHQAVERVLRLKEQRLSWESLPGDAVSNEVGSEPQQQLRDRAYALSTTLVRDEASLLPLRVEATEEILVVYPQRESWTQVEDRRYPHEFFVERIRQRHPQTTALTITPEATQGDYEAIYHAASTSGVVIMVTVNAYLDAQQVAVMRHVVALGRPVIGIAVYNPYDLLAFPELATYVVTYECTEPALEAAVQVLFGEVVAQGRLPVSLPGMYALMGEGRV